MSETMVDGGTRIGAPPGGGRSRASTISRALRDNDALRSKLILAGVIVVVALITTIGSDTFLTWGNWRNLLQQIAIGGIIAWGMTLLMVSGGIDLSVGSNLSVTGLIVAVLMRDGTSILLAILVGLAAATAVGVINGVLASRTKAHPFILTLGMLTLLQGVALLISSTPVSGLPSSFLDFAFRRVAGIPVTAVIAIVLGIICHIALSRTVYGRRLYAIGGSEEAARLAGVRVRTIKVATYAVVGLMVGLGAVLLTSTLSAGQAYAGQGAELTAIAAVAIGGTPLSGGRGDIPGTALGVLLIGMITNALNLLSIDAAVQSIVVGLIIVVAVMVQRQRS
jgi:ribose/xylose/arabinose/galactoside ABC-type transport system permease subunit